MTSKIFVETSIQVKRFIGASADQIEIERLLKSSVTAVTSRYVLMEFQRTVWADYVAVYNELYRHTSWDATALGLRSGQRAYQPRALGRCMQILTRIMVLSDLNRAYALATLENQLLYDMPLRFWHNITPLPDPIECDLVALGLSKLSDGSYQVANRCRKDQAACRLPEFLAEQRPRLQQLADYLHQYPKMIKDQTRVEQLLTAVISNPQAVLGQTVCWPLGDIIIALQIPPTAELWTIDSDFMALATALEIGLYQPS